ncbi:MAG: MGMT family protein [Candidatus Aenigmarchaeota archaeon]|nr:MGMT family protein [Candidatus Aenigmarchaeota archaeon]
MMPKLQKLLTNIPCGKITTYKIIANKLGTSPRAIGRMLSKNQYPDKYPCYKVVMSNCKLGGYSGGIRKKIALLEKDGIFVKRGKIMCFKEILYIYGGKQNISRMFC